MARKHKEELTKHTLFLCAGDFHRLGELYKNAKPSAVVRQLVRNHIRQLEIQLPKASIPDVDLEGVN